jgi:hypothetical protein
MKTPTILGILCSVGVVLSMRLSFTARVVLGSSLWFPIGMIIFALMVRIAPPFLKHYVDNDSLGIIGPNE